MSTATCTAPEDDLPFDASLSRLPPLRPLDVAAQRAFYAFHGSGLGSKDGASTVRTFEKKLAKKPKVSRKET